MTWTEECKVLRGEAWIDMMAAPHTETIAGMWTTIGTGTEATAGMWTTIGTGTVKEGVLIEVPGRLPKGMTPTGALLARLVCLTAIELHETSLMCTHMNPGRSKHPLETDGMGNMRPRRTHMQTLIGGHAEAGLISSREQAQRVPTTLAAVVLMVTALLQVASPEFTKACAGLFIDGLATDDRALTSA